MLKNFLNSKKPAQWLWLMFYSQLLSLCVTMCDSVLTGMDWLVWVNRGITAFSIICLFGMASVNKGYRISAVFRGIGLGVTVINALILFPWHLKLTLSNSGISDITGIFVEAANLVALVFSWIAVFGEYKSHGQLIPNLKGSWFLLFIISLCLTLFGSLISWISVFLVERFALNIAVVNVVAYGIMAINRLLQMVYLWNLYRTAKAFGSNPDE